MTGRLAMFLIGAITLSGCLSVRQQDLEAWVGQPVAALETQPVFLTMPVVKTTASDGTLIWNYVNGANIGSCSRIGNANVTGSSTVDYATYVGFTSCMQRFAACNNIFYIRDGKVLRYVPVGTGGMRCYTNEATQPHYSGPANIR